MATLQEILSNVSVGLQGFGAGVRGGGQQFLQNRQTQLTNLSNERRQGMLIDNRGALTLLRKGDVPRATQLLQNRVQEIQRLGGDPTDTQGLLDTITRGDIQGAIADSEVLDNAAVLRGFLPQPTAAAIPKVIKVDKGVAVMQDPTTGEVTTQRLQGFGGLSQTKDVQRSVNLPGGVVQLVYEDGTIELVEPSAQDRATIEAAEDRGTSLQQARSEGRAIGKVAGTKTEQRVQTVINEGVDAVQGIPILRRSLQLLERIETGGIDAARLRAKQLFGVEGADEGELSANLGRTVLGQLRATFGAAFTEKEGARLERMSAGFGKSQAANKRILRQSLKIATDAANRALAAARERGDTAAENDLLDFLDGKFDLTDESLAGIFTPGGTQTTPQDISSMTTEQLDAEIARQEAERGRLQSQITAGGG